MPGTSPFYDQVYRDLADKLRDDPDLRSAIVEVMRSLTINGAPVTVAGRDLQVTLPGPRQQPSVRLLAPESRIDIHSHPSITLPSTSAPQPTARGTSEPVSQTLEGSQIALALLQKEGLESGSVQGATGGLSTEPETGRQGNAQVFDHVNRTGVDPSKPVSTSNIPDHSPKTIHGYSKNQGSPQSAKSSVEASANPAYVTVPFKANKDGQQYFGTMVANQLGPKADLPANSYFNFSGDDTTTNLYPFQPYASLWPNETADPYESSRKGRFRLRRGKVNKLTPVNMMTEFVAFGDLQDDQIEEQDAVYTEVYLKLFQEESDTGTGIVNYTSSSIEIVEGGVSALPPDAPQQDDGTLPEYIVIPLCEVAWWGGAMHFYPGVYGYLNVAWEISGLSCQNANRNVVINSY